MSEKKAPPPTPASLAPLIDHTQLRAETLPSRIETACDEAIHHGFFSVCVNPIFVPLAARRLAGSAVLPITVIGFPLGATPTSVKVFETREAIAQGAREVDMVLPIGLLKAGQTEAVRADIQGVVHAAAPHPVKVILETALLTRDEKITACRLAAEAGAAFVKTSTGFGPGGATAEDIRLMRETVGPNLGVKASGGVRSWEDARKMVLAGANRIGTSSGIAIIRGASESESGY